ncbi:MAG: YceI family protein [Bacteroidia bacterium]
MKNTITISLTLIAVALFSAFNVIPDAPKWELDFAHSSVSFTTAHFFVPVEGKFDKFSGELFFDPANPATSKADFTIDVTSVNTKDTKRDNHLQSKDFFDAKTFPTMKFVSTRFEKKNDKEYIAHGKLTIRDVTKEIALPFKVLGVMEHPMKKGTEILGLQAETIIKRGDYGVGSGDWAADMVVASDVSVKITMELSRKK